MVETVVSKNAKARKQLDKAGHEADRKRVGDQLGQVRKQLIFQATSRGAAKKGYEDGLRAFCALKFDPERNPLMGSNPVYVGCTTTNRGGQRHNEGVCIEVTPKICGEIVNKMCR